MPVIPDAICKQRALAIIIAAGNAVANRSVMLQPLLTIFVPKMKRTISPTRSKRSKLLMECDCVNGIYFLCLAMALKTEVLVLLAVMKILNVDTALHAAYCIANLVVKQRHTTMLVLSPIHQNV